MQRCLILLATALPLVAHAQENTSRSPNDIASSFMHNAPWGKLLVLVLLMIAVAFAFRKGNR